MMQHVCVLKLIWEVIGSPVLYIINIIRPFHFEDNGIHLKTGAIKIFIGNQKKSTVFL